MYLSQLYLTISYNLVRTVCFPTELRTPSGDESQPLDRSDARPCGSCSSLVGPLHLAPGASASGNCAPNPGLTCTPKVCRMKDPIIWYRVYRMCICICICIYVYVYTYIYIYMRMCIGYLHPQQYRMASRLFLKGLRKCSSHL